MHAAERLRKLIGAGELYPGQRLSEARLSADLDVSRNTLREAFRTLTHENLLVFEPNKGVRVARPSVESMHDLYRIRRLLEVPVMRAAPADHPAGRVMREAVQAAVEASACGDWRAVGTANGRFHGAIIALANSPRLDQLHRTIAAELRLVFAIIEEPADLYRPYVAMNDDITSAYESGDRDRAADLLDEYLAQSERTLAEAYGHATGTHRVM